MAVGIILGVLLFLCGVAAVIWKPWEPQEPGSGSMALGSEPGSAESETGSRLPTESMHAPVSELPGSGSDPSSETSPPVLTSSGSAVTKPRPDGDVVVKESPAVDTQYFDDALFIGNSRTQGLELYGGLRTATFYASKGLTVKTAATKAAIDIDGEKYTVVDAVKKGSFGKVYIMLGLNELGWNSTQTFVRDYEALIDAVRAAQPDAAVYVQSILPVTQTKSDEGSYVNNERIDEFNALLLDMCERKQVYYVDVAAGVCDAAGVLPEDAATDGVHLKPAYVKQWVEYLKTHAVQ